MFENITSQELDAFFDTRRNIRLISFAIASFACIEALIFSLPPLEVFCLAYLLSTFFGILYVRYFMRIKRPRYIYRDDRYYVPLHHPRPGYITPAQYFLRSLGITFYGPVDV